MCGSLCVRPCRAGRAGGHRERSSDKEQLFVCFYSEAGLVVQNASDTSILLLLLFTMIGGGGGGVCVWNPLHARGYFVVSFSHL